MTAAQQALWDDDPSPSFDDIAAEIGVELRPTSPQEPGSDVEWKLQAFWPGLCGEWL